MVLAEVRDVFNQSIGKDIPAMGPFKNYKPNLKGPGGAKIKGAILAGQFAWKYFFSKPKLVGIVAGTAIAGGLQIVGPSNNQFNQTYSSNQFGNRYSRKYKQCKPRIQYRSRCNCNSNTGANRKYRKGNLYRTMGYKRRRYSEY